MFDDNAACIQEKYIQHVSHAKGNLHLHASTNRIHHVQDGRHLQKYYTSLTVARICTWLPGGTLPVGTCPRGLSWPSRTLKHVKSGHLVHFPMRGRPESLTLQQVPGMHKKVFGEKASKPESNKAGRLARCVPLPKSETFKATEHTHLLQGCLMLAGGNPPSAIDLHGNSLQ